MKTHNAVIYHCQSCGSVSHRDCNAVPPTCCGREMTRAAGETICESNGDVLGKLQEVLSRGAGETPAAHRHTH